MGKKQNETTSDDAAKDESFRKVAALAEELIASHGKDFTMGTFILAARYIAQGRSFSKEDASIQRDH
ncbi:MAG: hypothetical protein QNJ92_04810 [Alphaproteobacteria bacterium]|nr:hypothetical protein [Alphaproteobacteria bacterium]